MNRVYFFIAVFCSIFVITNYTEGETFLISVSDISPNTQQLFIPLDFQSTALSELSFSTKNTNSFIKGYVTSVKNNTQNYPSGITIHSTNRQGLPEDIEIDLNVHSKTTVEVSIKTNNQYVSDKVPEPINHVFVGIQEILFHSTKCPHSQYDTVNTNNNTYVKSINNTLYNRRSYKNSHTCKNRPPLNSIKLCVFIMQANQDLKTIYVPFHIDDNSSLAIKNVHWNAQTNIVTKTYPQALEFSLSSDNAKWPTDQPLCLTLKSKSDKLSNNSIKLGTPVKTPSQIYPNISIMVDKPSQIINKPLNITDYFQLDG